ncbi:MAG: thioesterase family protein [Ignavibacteriaceae bacterium]
MLKHQTEIRVRYADTDQMQFVYNGKYFEYFEVGRTEMMRDNNLTYRKIEESGYNMPVLEAFVKYVSPAQYDEVLIIETRVENMPSLKVHIDHTIISKERKVVIAEGYIELVFINAKTKKAVRPPGFFVDAMKQFF